jgi:phage tail-like protein
MTGAADLLPPGSSVLEQALAHAMTDLLPVPIEDVLDPARTPKQFLPFLGAHRSVDLWFDDWSEERKRQMVEHAIDLAQLKGTGVAAERYLAFVDTTIVHKVSHPARYPVGRIAAGITPVQHQPLVARFLLKVPLVAHPRSICVARTAIGHAAVRTFNREPLSRAKLALSVSKAPATAYSVTFAHRVPVTVDDGINLDAGQFLGAFKDRIRL